MGLCEKCDDRASGRLNCDLTSEGEGDIVHVREKGEERTGNGLRKMRGDGEKNDRKSDALKGY